MVGPQSPKLLICVRIAVPVPKGKLVERREHEECGTNKLDVVKTNKNVYLSAEPISNG